MGVHYRFEELFLQSQMATSKRAIAFQLSIGSLIVLMPKRPKVKWMFSEDYILGNCIYFLIPQGQYLLSSSPGEEPVKGNNFISFVFQGK